MKKIFSMFMVLAAALMFCSCNDTMDDKADIDGGFVQYDAPTVTLAAEASDFQTIMATISVSDSAAIIEEGVVLTAGETQEFIAASEIASKVTVAIEGLTEQTQYTLQAYVVTKSSATVISETKVTVTTPAMPVISVEGTYLVTEFELDDNDEWAAGGEPYEMTIKIVNEEEGEVEITNFWGGEMTVTGFIREDGSIAIPTGQQIYDHPSYGPVAMVGLNDEITAYADYIILTPNVLDFMSSPWAAQVSAGNFGFYMVIMKRVVE